MRCEGWTVSLQGEPCRGMYEIQGSRLSLTGKWWDVRSDVVFWVVSSGGEISPHALRGGGGVKELAGTLQSKRKDMKVKCVVQ